MLEIAIAVALGIIIAVLVIRFWFPLLVIGIFLAVVGALFLFVGVRVYESYAKVTVENPEAPFVLAGIIAFFAALAAAYYWWTNRPTRAKDDMVAPGSNEG